MTFFENELRKTVGAVFPDAKYIGRAAYVELGGDNCAKFEFTTLGTEGQYEAIQASVINRSSGVIDSVSLCFKDLFPVKKFAWTYNGKTEWYGQAPSGNDYARLADSIYDYAEVFQMTTPSMMMEQNM